MTFDLDKLAQRINSCRSFILCSHIRPDCDALGSELGMAGVLQQLGKQVRIINGHPTPPILTFLDPSQKIEVIHEHVRPESIQADCFIVLDTSAWAQLGPMGEVLRGFPGVKLCIDHHVGEDDLGTEFFKDTSAEATGHLVAKIAKHMGVTMTKQMATALYAAIATDTGWFRFSSTTPDTYRVIAELVEAGAVPSQITRTFTNATRLAVFDCEVVFSREPRRNLMASLSTRMCSKRTFLKPELFRRTPKMRSI